MVVESKIRVRSYLTYAIKLTGAARSDHLISVVAVLTQSWGIAHAISCDHGGNLETERAIVANLRYMFVSVGVKRLITILKIN